MTTNSNDEWKGLEGFVDELRRLEAPEGAQASGDLRVSSARSGARARMGWQVAIAVTGLAALALAYVAGGGWTSGPDSADTTQSAVRADDSVLATPSSDPRQAIADLLSPWPTYAYAQTPGRAREAPYPPLTALDPSRLRPGRRSYVRLSANDYHESLPHEAWTTTLDTVRYRGATVWRLVRRIDRTSNWGGDASSDDTLWLRTSDLRPVARRVHIARTWTSSQAFTDTSMVEVDTIVIPPGARPLPRYALGARRSTYHSNSPFLVSTDMLRLLLRAAPLTINWRASVQVPTAAHNALPNPAGYVNLRVAGVDTVQLFSGRFPCWRVVIEKGATPEKWCVSQETGETLVTDGPFDTNYPESNSILLYGLDETKRVPPIRRR